MSFNELSEELIEQILENLVNHKTDLNSAIRTSKKLYRVGWPLLWCDIDITWSARQLFTVAYHLMKSSERGNTVRRFSCVRPPDTYEFPAGHDDTNSSKPRDRPCRTPEDAVDVFDAWRKATGYPQEFHSSFSMIHAKNLPYEFALHPFLLRIILCACPNLEELALSELACSRRCPKMSAPKNGSGRWRWHSLRKLYIVAAEDDRPHDLTDDLLESISRYQVFLAELDWVRIKYRSNYRGLMQRRIRRPIRVELLRIQCDLLDDFQIILHASSIVMECAPNLKRFEMYVQNVCEVNCFHLPIHGMLAMSKDTLQTLIAKFQDSKYEISSSRRGVRLWDSDESFHDWRSFVCLRKVEVPVFMLFGSSTMRQVCLNQPSSEWSGDIRRQLQGQLLDRLPPNIEDITIDHINDLGAMALLLGLSARPALLTARYPKLTQVRLRVKRLTELMMEMLVESFKFMCADISLYIVDVDATKVDHYPPQAPQLEEAFSD